MPADVGLKACESCRIVVVRAYRELREHGLDEEAAFRAALKVLTLRHPERREENIAAVASEWIFGKPESTG